jgi:flagellar biosynthesis/type III secretory pathway protein FliH
VVELRSPSNRRYKERIKRKKYFENGTLVVWDVDPRWKKIWVYEVEDPETTTEYGLGDTISCERLFPGWQRQVDDFFSSELTAEDIAGQAAKEWRAESRAEGLVEGRAEGLVEGRAEGLVEGRAEGELEGLRKVLLLQAHLRFGAEKLPDDLENQLVRYNLEQLTALVGSIATSLTLEDWLSNFPT